MRLPPLSTASPLQKLHQSLETGRLCVGVHALLEIDAQLFPDALELLEVFVVLTLALHLGLDACILRVSLTCFRSRVGHAM